MVANHEQRCIMICQHLNCFYAGLLEGVLLDGRPLGVVMGKTVKGKFWNS